MDNQYNAFFLDIKKRILLSQQKAILSVNVHLLFLYWEIGNFISAQKEKLGWGAKVIKQLSKDLSKEFPEMKGFSERNLRYMVLFAETYSPQQINKMASTDRENSILQPVVAQLKYNKNKKVQPLVAKLQQSVNQYNISFYDFAQNDFAKITWSHHLILIDKTKTTEERKYYIQRTYTEGWSKRVLSLKIEQKLFESQGNLPNNFDATLPPIQSELAKQTLKDHYLFDFLNLGNEAREKEIENALLKEITTFLLELGNGFAFMGQQYHLSVGNQDYYLDLLFFHTLLNCYFIIELKIDDFKPEYAGKLNFYLNAVDDILKKEPQNQTIGLLLCKSANKIIAEYSLKDNNKPIGVATYKILPKEEKFIALLNQKLKNE